MARMPYFLIVCLLALTACTPTTPPTPTEIPSQTDEPSFAQESLPNPITPAPPGTANSTVAGGSGGNSTTSTITDTGFDVRVNGITCDVEKVTTFTNNPWYRYFGGPQYWETKNLQIEAGCRFLGTDGRIPTTVGGKTYVSVIGGSYENLKKLNPAVKANNVDVNKDGIPDYTAILNAANVGYETKFLTLPDSVGSTTGLTLPISFNVGAALPTPIPGKGGGGKGGGTGGGGGKCPDGSKPDPIFGCGGSQ